MVIFVFIFLSCLCFCFCCFRPFLRLILLFVSFDGTRDTVAAAVPAAVAIPHPLSVAWLRAVHPDLAPYRPTLVEVSEPILMEKKPALISLHPLLHFLLGHPTLSAILMLLFFNSSWQAWRSMPTPWLLHWQRAHT
jgi:hypothetical protein